LLEIDDELLTLEKRKLILTEKAERLSELLKRMIDEVIPENGPGSTKLKFCGIDFTRKEPKHSIWDSTENLEFQKWVMFCSSIHYEKPFESLDC
jgi:hypothetical protein